MKKTKYIGYLVIMIAIALVGCAKNTESSTNVKNIALSVDENTCETEVEVDGKKENVTDVITENIAEEKKELFPYITEDGKLEVQSLFQFSGFNPDCNDEEGENIAALHVKNISSEHLKKADLVAVLEDGTRLMFRIDELPPYQSMMVFAKDNATYDDKSVLRSIAVDTQFENGNVLLSDKINIEIEDVFVTVTNLCSEKLTKLTVKCHCMLDADCFGGIAYNYSIESIGPGESITLEVFECYLGSVLVAKVEMGN